MQNNRPFRKRLFAGLAVVAGVVLLAFEVARPAATSSSAAEQWFWVVVALALIGLGAAELVNPSAPRGPLK